MLRWTAIAVPERSAHAAAWGHRGVFLSQLSDQGLAVFALSWWSGGSPLPDLSFWCHRGGLSSQGSAPTRARRGRWRRVVGDSSVGRP